MTATTLLRFQKFKNSPGDSTGCFFRTVLSETNSSFVDEEGGAFKSFQNLKIIQPLLLSSKVQLFPRFQKLRLEKSGLQQVIKKLCVFFSVERDAHMKSRACDIPMCSFRIIGDGNVWYVKRLDFRSDGIIK